SGRVTTSLYSLANPPTGTGNVVVTASGATSMVGTSISYYNVASLGNTASGTQTGASGYTESLTSASGRLVVDVVGINSTANLTATSAGETARFGTGIKGSANAGNMSDKAGAASVTMTWSASAGTPAWASAAVGLVPTGITDPGITLYFTCDPSPCDGATGPAVEWSGNGMRIGDDGNPLVGNPDWAYMFIWVDNTEAQGASTEKVQIKGGANVDIAGRIYAVNSLVDMTGNAGETVALNLNIIANQISFSGGDQF